MYQFVDTVPQEGQTRTSHTLQTKFNGFNLDEVLTDETGRFRTLSVTGRNTLVKRVNTLAVDGMHGVHEEGNATIEVREISVKYLIEDDTSEGLNDKFVYLNDIVDEQKKILSFSDEDVFYYASFVANETEEENQNSLICTLEFVCADPFKYGSLVEAVFPSDFVYLENEGTVHTKPVFRLEAVEDSPYGLVQNKQGDFMMIGSPSDVAMNEVEPRTVIMDDTMNNLVGWSTPSSGIVDGAISGEMMADDYRFYTTDYGSGTYWHGPAVIKSLSETITDFRVEVHFELLNTQPNNTGRVELYLVDSGNNVVGKIALKNVDRGSTRNYAEIRIGDGTVNHFIIHEFGESNTAWANFYGVLRLSRKGNEWEAYVAKINEDGDHVARRFERWEDSNNQFTSDIASVVAHLGQYGDNSVTTNRIHHVKVYRLNDLGENETPYHIQQGDVITLDHENEVVRINGEVRKDLKQFGSSYFPLLPGRNELYVFPELTYTIKATYRERFK